MCSGGILSIRLRTSSFLHSAYCVTFFLLIYRYSSGNFLFVFCVRSAVVFRGEDLCGVQTPGKRHKLLIDTYRRKNCLVSSTSLRCLAEACLPKASNLDLKTTRNGKIIAAVQLSSFSSFISAVFMSSIAKPLCALQEWALCSSAFA